MLFWLVGRKGKSIIAFTFILLFFLGLLWLVISSPDTPAQIWWFLVALLCILVWIWIRGIRVYVWIKKEKV